MIRIKAWAWLPAFVVIGTFGMHSAQAAFNITVEAPGVLNSTATFSSYGVETFDGLSSGLYPSFDSSFGGTSITGSFSNATIVPANQYGGAGGGGNYVTDNNGNFSMTTTSNLTYFGLWISALNSTNNLDFYNGTTLVESFVPADLIALVIGNSAYKGNPSWGGIDKDPGEPFAFVNFFDTTGTFNKITVSGFGYESDNYTVGTFTSQSGVAVGPVADVPEPLSLALLGIGIAGLGMVKRQRTV